MIRAPSNSMMIPAYRLPLTTLIALGALAAPAWAEPTASWIAPGTEVRTGETVEVTCRVASFDGGSVGSVLPVDPPSLDWGRLELVRAVSAVDGDGPHFDQVFALRAAAPGTFTLPEIDVPYVEANGTAGDAAPTVRADSLSIEIREPNRAMNRALMAAGLAAVVAAGVVALRIRRQRAWKRVGDAPPAHDAEAARVALTRAKACRIEGDFYGYYRALGDVVSALGDRHAQLLNELAARAEAAGYGGARPDDAALDSDYRAVKRALRESTAADELETDTNATQHEVGAS